MNSPLILITNDDGYQAAGLMALVATVSRFADVYVVAPDGARSGAGCAITSTRPVSFTEHQHPDCHLFVCSGTPVDCVKLALEQIVPRRPALVLSGINHGDNASVSIHYSGTMGAVMEACMKGIPAIGFSLYLTRGQRYEDHPVDAQTLEAISALCQRVLLNGLPQDVCLNVNLPVAHRFRGWAVCRMARGAWSAEWISASHPSATPHFWLTGTFTDLEPEANDTDFSALREGYCSIVPISIDMTAHKTMAQVDALIR